MLGKFRGWQVIVKWPATCLMPSLPAASNLPCLHSFMDWRSTHPLNKNQVIWPFMACQVIIVMMGTLTGQGWVGVESVLRLLVSYDLQLMTWLAGLPSIRPSKSFILFLSLKLESLPRLVAGACKDYFLLWPDHLKGVQNKHGNHFMSNLYHFKWCEWREKLKEGLLEPSEKSQEKWDGTFPTTVDEILNKCNVDFSSRQFNVSQLRFPSGRSPDKVGGPLHSF